MKKRTNTYREVNKLPDTAVTVHEYADQHNYDPSYVYKQWRGHIGLKKKKIPFEIVLFKTMNYVIPIKQKEAKP